MNEGNKDLNSVIKKIKCKNIKSKKNLLKKIHPQLF